MASEIKKANHILANFNAVSRRKQTRTTAFIDKIITERPDLADQTFYRPEEGNCAIVLMVGDEVFKMPKSKKATPEFEREIEILQLMKEHNTPFMPELTYISADKTFFSMKRIAGVTLNSVHESMSEKQMNRLALDIGAARAKIEISLRNVDFPFSKKFNRGDRHAKNVKGALKLWSNPFFQRAFAQLEPEHQEAINDFVRAAKDRKESFCHVDLHRGNILIDPKTKRLTGFVDVALAIKSKFPHREFEHTMIYYVFNERSQVKDAFRVYAQKSQGLHQINDLFAYRVLGNFHFWLQNAHKKSPDIAARGVANAVESIERHVSYFHAKSNI